MPARTTPEHGDRVTWRGQKGTIIDTHSSGKPHGPAFGVLPDAGPHRLHLWPKSEVEVGIGVYPSQCPRCGGKHRAASCQAEYLASKQARSSNQVAQQPSPQPVAATPAPGWDVDF